MIASIGRRGHARNPNQVEIQRKIYLSDFFIHNGDINIIGVNEARIWRPTEAF